MALKVMLDNLDDVDETLKSQYQQVDGKYVLDLDDSVKSHPKISALNSAFDRQKAVNTDLKNKLTEAETKIEEFPADFDPVEYEALKASTGDKPDLDEIRRVANEQAEAKAQRKIDKANDERDAAQTSHDAATGKLNSRIIDGDLTSLLIEAGVDPENLTVAKAALRGMNKFTVEEADGKDVAMVEGQYGPTSIKEFIKEWAEGPHAKPFIPDASGGNSSGNGGKGGTGTTNPWGKDTKNVTRQGELISKEPEKAKRMMQEAGLPDSRISTLLGSVAA